MTATAVPVKSVATVKVCASGIAGLLVAIPIGAKTTSKRIWRATSGAPPGPVATAVAVPVWPEHKLGPQSVPLGGNFNALNIGAGLTVTATGTVSPAEHYTLRLKGVSTGTLDASSTLVEPETACVTARTSGM